MQAIDARAVNARMERLPYCSWPTRMLIICTAGFGLVLPKYGSDAVFVMFGIFAFIGAVICAGFAIETRGRVLEELAPAKG